MSRRFSWNAAFKQDLDPSWTVQEFVFDWLKVQLGEFLSDQGDEEDARCFLLNMCDAKLSLATLGLVFASCTPQWPFALGCLQTVTESECK